MQVKTNIRAGKKSGTVADDNPGPESTEGSETYVPPVSRCTGA